MIRSGFTLIELLVAISIISMLASLLIPSVTTVRRLSQQTTCLNHQRQVGLAIEGYRGDNDGIYPLCGLHSGDNSWSTILTPKGLPTPGTPGAVYPPYAYDTYFTTRPQPYLFAALVNYEMTPPSNANGAVPANWRCPARQTTRIAGGRPYMMGVNDFWRLSFRWNYQAAGRSAVTKGASKARLLWDYSTPDWLKFDLMHADGTTNVIFADLHGAKEGYDTWRTQNPSQTWGGENTNAWYLDGWRQ